MQERVVLAALLNRAALRALGAATAAQKMRIHQRAEEEAWALPAEVAALAKGLGPDDALPGDAAVRAALDRVLKSL